MVGQVSHTRYRPCTTASGTPTSSGWSTSTPFPRLAWPTRLLARFDARDHLDGGRLGGGIRGDVERFLAAAASTSTPPTGC